VNHDSENVLTVLQPEHWIVTYHLINLQVVFIFGFIRLSEGQKKKKKKEELKEE
jgi:hypothetical protein